MKLTKAVILNGYRPRKDKSVTLTFETQEQTADDVSAIHSMVGSMGALYFKAENQLTEAELKEFDNLDLEYNGQSKSKRLKNVLYRYWQQSESSMNEKEFYSDQMETIIQHFKNKLE